jgi:serine/threonine protein kinase
VNATPSISEVTTCRLCHEIIGPDDSHRGYCFGCLLVPALDLEKAEHDADGWFDPYEILTHADGSFIELGRGSMGITYKALDTTLQFPVALKAIDLKAAGLEANRERFLREARAAARLRHPHVASVLYYGVRKDGQCFYAMELVEGETLAQRIQRAGPFPEKDALEVIAQVASALQAAEKFGLIHRDLKPANIMLAAGPNIDVKVIDFGLAKVIGSQEPADRITNNGFVGTPAFASPEQFSGEEIDQRSDYFSLGSTLYYLLTGAPPSQVNRLGALPAKKTEASPRPGRLNAMGVTTPVRGLLRSLLSMDPSNRPHDGKALTEAIHTCRSDIAAQRKRKSVWLLAAVPTALLAAGALVYSSGIFVQNNSQKSVAVLPFDNLSPMGDKAYFADGVQDEILTTLGSVADLQVISRGSVQAYRNPATRPLPAEIGRALHVNYLVNGGVERDSDRIRVSIQLIEAKTGRELWAQRYDSDLKDVFTIQTEIAEVISRELQAKLSSAEKASIEETPTRDMVAYELYLHAKEVLTNYHEDTQGWEPIDNAVRLLDEAVRRDPGFAMAWCRLAAAHDYAYWYGADHTEARRASAENALQKALSLRPDLGEIHLGAALHLLVTTHDNAAIREQLEIARRTLPNSAYVFDLSSTVDSRQGRWKDAWQDYEKESKVAPQSLALIIHRYLLYSYHRQYDELRRMTKDISVGSANLEPLEFVKATTAFEETGDTTALHALFNDPTRSLHANGRATLAKITCRLADRNFAAAEEILSEDPQLEFEAGQRRFLSREFLLGWIKYSAGDTAGAKIAYAVARPLQLAYVQKWPDNPNPLMVLAITDAALGAKQDAIDEARKAVKMKPMAEDAIEMPPLAVDLAQVYLLCGERELAIEQLQSLEQVPRALTYGTLAKAPDWDLLRSDPRFQEILSDLKPIPIVNRSAAGN